MHRCLEIPEVLDAIFDELSGDTNFNSPWFSSKKSLCAAARTCKRFHECAIKYIWQVLPTIDVIFEVFASDMFKISGEGTYRYLNFFVLTEDKERIKLGFQHLQKYARHVKVVLWVDRLKPPIGNKNKKDIPIHPDTFRKIYEQEYFIRPLFPNVQHVQLPILEGDDTSTIFYPSLVLSPSLKRVSIHTSDGTEMRDVGLDTFVNTSDYLWEAVTGRIADVAPSLLTFDISNHPENCPRLSDYFCFIGRRTALDRLLPHFSSTLKHLKLDSLVLHGETFGTINNLTGLVKMDISLVRQQQAEMDHLPSASLCLPSLEHLVLGIFPEAPYHRFFQILKAEKLKRIEFTVFIGDEAEYDPESLFLALRTNLRLCDHLEEIELTQRYDPGNDNFDNFILWHERSGIPRFIVSNDTFTPLLAFSNLTSLQIRHCNSSTLEDSTLAQMFLSWPRIQSFHLHDQRMQRDQVPDTRLTIGGVHRALRHTPMLRRLTLRFDARLLPNAEAEGLPTQQSMEYLDVCTSPIRSGDRVAAYMTKYFPSVARLNTHEFLREGLSVRFIMDGEEDEEEADIWRAYRAEIVMVDRWNDVMRVINEVS
ncbi:hypothetical protein CC1G_12308 [Coprinopsis cinerea okayama7|uniref:F-box domain-containing protein n=1 Tax=Coprinopsis cinerea (strain Okayama-7 / 130 / ATCC MYA-4618 / FGSC 9003) TaxID=240176 RepID=A8NLV1_COPC7|nr:hypothetical protein CC1G_12308 [Coprinopsis cinerea okayama7\|eukprot:XP_001834781.1 hypothetical protein CC1G_12308 [Coprinopsis cinerea okayama7\